MIKTPKEILDLIKTIPNNPPKNSRNQYKSIKVNGLKVSESRYIWEKHYGKIPEDNMIHHINGIKTDNRIENLQCVTRLEHGRLHSKKSKDIRVKE